MIIIQILDNDYYEYSLYVSDKYNHMLIGTLVE